MQICPLAKVTCSMCTQQVLRKELEQHQACGCAHSHTTCTWQEAGCSWKGELQERAEHLQECAFESMKEAFSALLCKIHAQQAQICSLEQQHAHESTQTMALQSQVAQLQQELNKHLPSYVKPCSHNEMENWKTPGAACSYCDAFFVDGYHCVACNSYQICAKCHYHLYLK